VNRHAHQLHTIISHARDAGEPTCRLTIWQLDRLAAELDRLEARVAELEATLAEPSLF